MRPGSAVLVLGSAAAALLSSCSPEPARRDGGDEKVAEAAKPSTGGSRLRAPGGPTQPQVSDGADGVLGCALVVVDGEGGDASRVRGGVLNHVLVNARGEILWNGSRIDASTLGKYLDLVASMTPTPLTVVRTEPGADPKAVEAVRDAVSRSLDCPLEAY